MPRMRGPRKKPNGGPNFYACVTVPKALRATAGRSELWCSLGTAYPTQASKFFGAVIEALERELEALVGEPDLRELEEHDPCFVAELLTQNGKYGAVELPLVYEALKNNEPLALTWEQLHYHHVRGRFIKKGQPLSDAVLFEINKGIGVMRRCVNYPHLPRNLWATGG